MRERCWQANLLFFVNLSEQIRRFSSALNFATI